MKKFLILLIITIFPTIIFSHCEIPCGIYHDRARIHMIEEHITTIEKSMNLIIQLSQNPQNYNQLVRWVVNKEKHADEISHIIKQYFMTQRLLPVEETDKLNYKKYIHKLVLLHKLLIYNMKSKQTTDLAHVKKMKELLAQFENAYFSPHIAHAFNHTVEAYRKKDLDLFWSFLDKENRYKRTKKQFEELFKNEKEYNEINEYLKKAEKKISEGELFEIKGTIAELKYEKDKSIKMILENEKWFFNDFE